MTLYWRSLKLTKPGQRASSSDLHNAQRQELQPHHQLTLPWACSSQCFSHIPQEGAGSAFRGCPLSATINRNLVVQSLTPHSQADSLLCIPYPIKLEHHNQGGKGGSPEGDTGAEIGQMKPWIKSALAANIVLKHILWQYLYLNLCFLLLWKVLPKVLNVWPSQLTSVKTIAPTATLTFSKQLWKSKCHYGF